MTMLRGLRGVALGLAIAIASPLAMAQQPAPPTAQAPKSVDAEFFVLHATNDGKGIDNEIDWPELRRPPFSSYNSYKLLAKSAMALPLGEGKELKLPNDRILIAKYKGLAPPKAKEPPKHIINLTIQKPGGKEVLPLVEVNAMKGERFFVAGQSYRGGILVIVMRLPAG